MREKGQSLVEFALFFTLLVFVLFATAALVGRAMSIIRLDQASWNATRAMSQGWSEDSVVEQALGANSWDTAPEIWDIFAVRQSGEVLTVTHSYGNGTVMSPIEFSGVISGTLPTDVSSVAVYLYKLDDSSLSSFWERIALRRIRAFTVLRVTD